MSLRRSSLARFTFGALGALVTLVTLSACRGMSQLDPSPAPEPTRAAPSPPAPDAAFQAGQKRFTVHVVDVGTGLGVFVEGPDFSLVYDAGSNDDLATGPSNRFVAYLRAASPKLEAIDHVFLSHPHRDHVELLTDVMASYRVANVWDSGASSPLCAYRRFLQAVAAEPGVSYRTAARDEGKHAIKFPVSPCGPEVLVPVDHGARIPRGLRVPLGASASAMFLHVDGEHHPNLNENSLVVRLDLAGTSVLLMGDAEAGGRNDPSKAPTRGSVEGELLACCRRDLDADVLVVAHHGSKSSSRAAFLEAVTPKVSVVSSGPAKYNQITLPDAEVIEELKKHGPVLRTDIDDEACAVNPRKVGPDADKRPGGCDHVRVVTTGGGRVEATTWRGSD